MTIREEENDDENYVDGGEREECNASQYQKSSKNLESTYIWYLIDFLSFNKIKFAMRK